MDDVHGNASLRSAEQCGQEGDDTVASVPEGGEKTTDRSCGALGLLEDPPSGESDQGPDDQPLGHDVLLVVASSYRTPL